MDQFLWRNMLLEIVVLVVLFQWYLQHDGFWNILAMLCNDISGKRDEWDITKGEDANKMAEHTTFCVLQHLFEVNDTELRLLFVSYIACFLQCTWVTRRLMEWTSKSISFSEINEGYGKQVTKFLPENIFPRGHVINVYVSSIDKYVAEQMNQTPHIFLMKYEWERYKSFKTFPLDSSMTPMRLAQAGFFYTGTAEKVQCFCCGITSGDWTPDETAIEVHKRLSPNCAFIRGEESENIPIHPENEIKLPEYASFESRRISFTTCPSRWSQDKDTLASAGFCYTGGEDDRVTCFYCGITLGQWKKEEDPWIEHAKHSPRCGYLLLQRGEEFVNKCSHGATKCLPAPEILLLSRPEVNAFITYEKKCTKLRKVLQAKNRELSAQREVIESLHRQLQVIKGAKDRDLTTQRQNIDYHKKQITQLNRRNMCKICMDNDANIVFLPCGHMVACEKCAFAIGVKCCICRNFIKGQVKVYHA